MNLYNYKHFIFYTSAEKKLMKEIENKKAQNLPYNADMTALHELQSELRGIEYRKKSVYVNDIKFVDYILKHFFVFCLGESVFFYKISERHYVEIPQIEIKVFFKNLLDEVEPEAWDGAAEGRYLARFIREIPKRLTEYKMPGDVIVFRNGMYDLVSRKFSPKHFADTILNIASSPVLFDKTATCPQFEKFIWEILDNGKDTKQVVMLMQEICGYTFCYGSCKAQKIFMFFSSGRSGKSLLCNLLKKMHSENLVSSVSVDTLSEEFGLSNIHGKVLNITGEVDSSKKFSTTVLKAASGCDSVEVNKKFKDPFTAVLTTKFIVVANQPLNLSDDSLGLQERIIPVKFTKSYVSNPKKGSTNMLKADPKLEDKLEIELPGIVNWCLEGLHRLEENNWDFTMPASVEETRREYCYSANTVDEFVENCIELEQDGKILRTTLYENFKCWISKHNVPAQEYLQKKRFYQKFEDIMRMKGITKPAHKTGGSMHYIGVKMKTDWLNQYEY